MSEKKERRLTNVAFFRLCEELRNQRERLTTERPTLVDAAKLLSDLLKFEVAPQTVRQGLEAVGFAWQPRRPVAGAAQNSNGGNASRVLMYELLRTIEHLNALCASLGFAAHEVGGTTLRLKEYYEASRNGGPTGDSIHAIAADVAPAAPASTPAGTALYKVGDAVCVDGTPGRRVIKQMRGGGRFAVLDDNHEVQVSRLKLLK